jgi:hypothetical protein
VIENSSRPADTRVDELRQQLRALGYLDAGVDRFLLGPTKDSYGPRVLAIRAGIRVGLLAGILLGPATTMGLGARLPGLVTGPRDAAVLGAYMAILFFAVFAVLSAAISLAASAFARPHKRGFTGRARRVASVAGWSMTIACLVYLTLWWRSANAGFGWSAPVLTVAALALAVIISLLLGHAVRITTLAVLGSAVGASRALPPIPPRSWRLIVSGGVVAFIGAAALLLWTAPADAFGRNHPALTVVSHGRRVRLIAIDGFDRALADQLSRAGRLPRFEWILRGERAPLAAEDTSDPARVWTSVATGVPPDVHGVHAIETRRVAGVQGIISAGSGAVARMVGAGTDTLRLTRPAVASREERRAKTLWEVASDAGLRTAAINWWATWPAPARSGIVLTDRAVLRLERGGTLDAEIAPADVYDQLRVSWSALRERARAAAASRFSSSDVGVNEVLRRSAELDATVIEMVRALPESPRDLDVIYLPGLDIAQHALLGSTEAGALAPSTVATRVEGLRSYYVFLDWALSPVVQPRQGVVTVVVTLPGRVQTPSEGIIAIAPASADSVQGDLTIRASTAEPLAAASTLDIAPTIYYALGIPLSRELAGTPLRQLFGPSAPEPDRFVTTYGRPSAEPVSRKGEPLDQEMIDRLRSLGYVR